MDEVLAGLLSKERFQSEILGGFAVLALLLAAVGLYGVLSHLVTANRAQIGIRLALGAPRSVVFRMIAARSMTLAGIGAFVGTLGCVALRHVLAGAIAVLRRLRSPRHGFRRGVRPESTRWRRCARIDKAGACRREPAGSARIAKLSHLGYAYKQGHFDAQPKTTKSTLPVL